MPQGSDIVDVAKRCVGQKYVLGAMVPKNNSNWKGPWDCAEFVSWCAYQAYGAKLGMRPRDAAKGDAYSGFWFEDAMSEPGAAISVKDALKVAGAVLVRKARKGLIGHVAISLGDGDRTIEARSSKLGVNIFKGAADRPWDIGMRLPGVDYAGTAKPIDAGGEAPAAAAKPTKLPKGWFSEQKPELKGPEVVAIQHALAKKKVDPGPVDGEFGPMTGAAVSSFQAMSGIEQDGIVGPGTAKALGLGFPITPTEQAKKAWAEIIARAKAPPPPPPKPKKLPKGWFAAQTPEQKGPEVVAIQHALAKKKFAPGVVDGEYGLMTGAAVSAFQAKSGIEQDGVVGPETAKALGLGFPIKPTEEAKTAWAEILRKAKASPPPKPKPAEAEPEPEPAPKPKTADVKPAAFPVRTIKRFIKSGTKHSVEFTDGTVRFVGAEVRYSDDMFRRGLWQDRDLPKIADAGMFDPADFVGSHERWAYFIQPTIKGESAGYFGRLNSYDRAAFTFGATQCAAHTPGENLILLFRALLKLPSAPSYFPELSLKNGKVTLTKPGGATVDLEEVVEVKRPNGVKEKQLKRFMDYLNPDPTEVKEAEVAAAAKLLQWTMDDPATCAAQLDVVIDRAKRLIKAAKSKVPAFDGSDWRQGVWIFDITYQGRGTYAQIKSALAAPNPLTRLSEIGASYPERRKTVREVIAAIEKSKKLNGFTV